MFNQFRFALGQIDPIYNGLPFLFKASMAGSDNVRKYKRITEPILAWIAVIVLWRLVDNWVLKLWFVSFALHLSYNGLISEKNRRDTIEAGVRQGWANARHARLLEESGVDE